MTKILKIDIGLPYTSGFPRTRPLFWPLSGRPGGFSKIGGLSGFLAQSASTFERCQFAKAYDGMRQRKLVSFGPATGLLGHRTALRQVKCCPKCAGDGAMMSAPTITKSTERKYFYDFYSQ